MSGRDGAGAVVRPSVDRARLGAALAVIVLLGSLGAVLGRTAGSGRYLTAQTSGGGSGGGSGGQAGSSGNSGNSAQGGSGSGQQTPSGGAPAPVAAPDDGTSGGSGSSGGSGASSPNRDEDGGGTGNTSPNAPGPGDTGPGDTTPGDTSGGTPSTETPGTTPPTGPTTTIPVTQSTLPSNLPANAAPTREVGCGTGAPASPSGGQVRCYEVVGRRDRVEVVGVPGIAFPLPLPVPLIVPVINDTGASTSNDVDQRSYVYVDVDNKQVIDAEAFARGVGQSILATLAVLLGVALAITVVGLLFLRRRGGGGPPVAPPGPTGPPVPGPGGTWVYYPPGTGPPGAPPPVPPPGPEEWPPPAG